MKTNFTNRKCPRCSGNLYFDMDYLIERGLISWFEQESCLQCGYISYESDSPQSRIAATVAVAQRELLPV